jgi:hypothetical protein
MLSIFPYVDFDEKHFLFNFTTGRYEFGKQSMDDPNPDIWHGVISPNSGSTDTDIQKLVEFLDKTHEFYQGGPRFEAIRRNEHTPAVFYMDHYREQQSAQFVHWRAYSQIYLPNQENLIYNRLNKYLAQKMYDAYQSFVAEDRGDISKSVQDKASQ